MGKLTKTNAMRLLDRDKIEYEILTYTIDKDKFSGNAVSNLLNVDEGSCYKTLSLINGHDVYLALISVKDELDLKKAAKAFAVKNLEMIHVKDLLKLVGYERGSVSPIGTKKVKKIIIDDECLNYEKIEISGGMMGISLLVDRIKIIDYLKADVKDIKK